MKITPFATEHFFAKYEFNTPHQLCNSDCETTTVGELLQMAGVEMAEFAGLSLGYTESAGNPALREALAAGYRTAVPDDILVLGTPVEGIYLGARAILDPGDEVVVLTPAYDALINMFAHIVGPDNVCYWPLQPAEKRWTLDFDQLPDLLTPRTKLVVVNFPHNPTGFLPSPQELDQLISTIEAHGCWLFYDEMYHGLVHSGTTPIPSAADLSPRAVVLSGLSKTYGLPGLRTGWLVVQDAELRANLLNWKFYTSICPPAPSEFLALAAWKVREQLRARSIAQIEANLVLAEEFFARWEGLFGWRRPCAGSVALVEMRVPSVTIFAEQLAQEAGVLIHPAVTLGGTDQQMRMGFGRRAFVEALERFERYLRKSGVRQRSRITW
jgi:aspartate/methionine/tyrosine aminotransferase